jgi:hypothetical protein
VVVHPLIAMDPKHVLVSHRANSFTIDVQPTSHSTAVSAPVEHVDRIVPAARGVAMMIEHTI